MTKVQKFKGIEPGVSTSYVDGEIVGRFNFEINGDNALSLVFDVDDEVGVTSEIVSFMYITLSDLESEEIELYNEQKFTSDQHQTLRFRYSQSSEPYTVEVFTTTD